MSALHFRIDRHAFRDTRNAPRHRRRSLLRIVGGLVGVVLLGVLVFFSVFVGAAMLAGGLLYRLVKHRRQAPARSARVVEAEYRVVGKPG
jgi:hypothetical protein